MKTYYCDVLKHDTILSSNFKKILLFNIVEEKLLFYLMKAVGEVSQSSRETNVLTRLRVEERPHIRTR